MKRAVWVALPVMCAAILIKTGHSQALPAPTVDRVLFPAGYDKWNVLYVLDRPDTKRILVTYANDIAIGVRFGQQGNYPYGSVIAQENWRALTDAQGNAILDENGRFQRDTSVAPTVNVMRKERGFGEGYREIRNGEWEYGSYRGDGTQNAPAANTGVCANCHLQAGPGKDWVMRASMNFNGASGAVPDGVIKNYAFVPGILRVKGGTTVTFYNDDVVEHTIAADAQGGYLSQRMRGGSSVSIRFPASPGEFNFHCSLHPNMKGKIIVE